MAVPPCVKLLLRYRDVRMLLDAGAGLNIDPGNQRQRFRRDRLRIADDIGVAA